MFDSSGIWIGAFLPRCSDSSFVVIPNTFWPKPEKNRIIHKRQRIFFSFWKCSLLMDCKLDCSERNRIEITTNSLEILFHFILEEPQRYFEKKWNYRRPIGRINTNNWRTTNLKLLLSSYFQRYSKYIVIRTGVLYPIEKNVFYFYVHDHNFRLNHCADKMFDLLAVSYFKYEKIFEIN